MKNQTHSERFNRLALILQDEGLQRLQQSTVMVLGLGGVGSSCAEALARGGVGTLIVLDRDKIEASNINRQTLAYGSTIGRVKADVMTEMIADINPDCKVISKQVFLTKENIPQILSSFPKPDYVIDCIDTVSQKLAIASWCLENNIALIASMGAANKLDPTRLKFSYIEKTLNCPLSKVMRKECRRRGIKHLEVLSSSELPFEIQNKASASKADTLGSMSYMPPIMGKMLAGKVIVRLAGIEEYNITPVAMINITESQ